MLTVILMSVVMLTVILMSVIMLTVTLMTVIMLNVVGLTVLATNFWPMVFFLHLFRSFFSKKNQILFLVFSLDTRDILMFRNGRGSAVNRTQDGSTYPG
jgi:hypothetical protein